MKIDFSISWHGTSWGWLSLLGLGEKSLFFAAGGRRGHEGGESSVTQPEQSTVWTCRMWLQRAVWMKCASEQLILTSCLLLAGHALCSAECSSGKSPKFVLGGVRFSIVCCENGKGEELNSRASRHLPARRLVPGPDAEHL